MNKKPCIGWKIHPGLLDALQARADAESRKQVSVLEEALAKHLAIPLAHPELPEMPVELCPACEKGVINRGRCAVCNWHRYPRPWKSKSATGTRTRDTKRELAKARKKR